ncbi:MAG: GGDEF domain-containing protein [bacterium]|nr:GGDEF domain-containing protein [bacterium]
MINLNLLFLLGNFLAISTSFVIAVFIYCTSSFKDKTKIAFIVLNLLICFWCFCPILINIDFIPHKLIIQKFSYIFALFLLPVFAEIVLVVEPKIRIFKNFLYLVSYTFLILLPTKYFIEGIVLVQNLYQSKPGIVYYFFIGYFGLSAAILLVILYKSFIKHKSLETWSYKRDVSKFLLFGYGLEYFAGLIYFLTILQIIPLYSFAGYITCIGVIMLFFVYYTMLKDDFRIHHEQKQTELQQYITETTKTLIELNDIAKLSKNIKSLLKRNTNASKIIVFFIEKDKYVNYGDSNRQAIPDTHLLIEILTSQHKKIHTQEVKKWAQEIKTKTFTELNIYLNQNDLEYIIPLFFGGLIGFIGVGYKIDKSQYQCIDIQIFDLVSYSASIALQNILLLTSSIKDDLTGLYNKNFFDKKLKEQISLSLQDKSLFTLIFLDIDNFHKLNEILGHPKCDEKLRQFASLAKDHFRINDIIARWGGEEFAIILPQTSLDNTNNVALKFLKLIEEEVEITASCGLSFFDGRDKKYHTQTLEHLEKLITQKADSNMYKAKKNGKNRVFY